MSKDAETAVVPDLSVDTRGTFCPMPVVQARQAIDQLEVGQTMELLANDPGVRADLPAWTTNTGHELLHSDQDGDTFRFLIRRQR